MKMKNHLVSICRLREKKKQVTAKLPIYTCRQKKETDKFFKDKKRETVSSHLLLLISSTLKTTKQKKKKQQPIKSACIRKSRTETTTLKPLMK